MSSKKHTRDPGAPKRNMSAYLLYQNAMREQFKAQNPGMTFGQLAKYTSAMYAEMPPAEKQTWVARAEADKQRYLYELANYVPPPGYDEKGDVIMQAGMAKRAGKRSSSGGIKDINAPKRNVSAYLLYQNAMRDQFKRENPGMTFGQLSKYTSHMYKNLTPEERATWDTHAAQDKARYDAELANYTPPPGHDSRGNLVEEFRVQGKRRKRAPKDPSAPKRARGSYVFFASEMRPQIMNEFPDIKFVDMGNILGQRWRALTPDEKKRFEDMAAQDKIRFHVEMQKYSGEAHHENHGHASLHTEAKVEPQQQHILDPNIQDPQAIHSDPNALLHQQYAQIAEQQPPYPDPSPFQHQYGQYHAA